MPPSKKKKTAKPVEAETVMFCNLSFESQGNKFAASGTEDYIDRQKDWFLEEFHVGSEEEEPGSDPDAG